MAQHIGALQAVVLIGSFVHVPGGTLGDIYTGIHVQIAVSQPPTLIFLSITVTDLSVSVSI